jgi:hypothetical protein
MEQKASPIKYKHRCRHKVIEVSFSIVKCCSCGKIWLQDKNNIYKDMSFRVGGTGEAGG